MAWASGGSPNSTYSTSLAELFVFGATDKDKNLVDASTYSTSGTHSTGSDAIGTYVGVAGSTEKLSIALSSSSYSQSDNAMSWMIAFSRTAATNNYSHLFTQYDESYNVLARLYKNAFASEFIFDTSSDVTLTYSPDAPTLNTEWAIVVTRSGTSIKLFYTGGGSAVTGTASGTYPTGPLGDLIIGNEFSGEAYQARYRAYARWNRALSDSDAQALANTPQDVLGVAAPAGGDTQRLARGTNRGIARGIYRHAADWIRTPSGLLVPA